MDIEKLKHKRGRKSKKELEFIKKYEEEHNISLDKKDNKPKKRGRKPKGGKIIKPEQSLNSDDSSKNVPNIILHLKCSSDDLEKANLFLSEIKYNPNLETIQPYNMNKSIESKGLQYYDIEVSNHNENIMVDQTKFTSYYDANSYSQCNYNENKDNENKDNEDKDNEDKYVDKKVLWEKLRNIQQILRSDMTSNKNSCCFRCTCSFDNPAISIPMHDINGIYKSYGNFCTPECATGFLFDEPIESSTKWERYSLLNNIYKPVYKYSSNIKPSPSPYYVLDKFFGTLTIKEYRELSRKNHYGVLMVVDKPLIRVMPELFNDTNDYTEVSKMSKYKLSRKKPPINKTVVNNKTWLF
jgi:hypothetical protein